MRQCALAEQSAACTLPYIQRALGVAHYSDRRACAFVAALIADHGFPRPFPSLMRGGNLTTQVRPRSSWQRAAVDAWLEGFVPPDCAATIDSQAMRAAATDMDDAAKMLRMVGGREYRARAL